MRMQRILALAVILVACEIATAAKRPFDDYQPILDRQMFGQLPLGFDPTKPPSEVTKSSQKELTKEQEQLKSAIHFSVINITPDGATAVGFTDNSDPKAPVHYYLKVGEKRNGWEVQEADPQKATMTIAKGDIVVSLELGANSAKSAGATSAAKPAVATTAGRTNLPSSRLSAGGGLATSRLGGFQAGRSPGSLRELKAQREAERQARAEEAAAKAKAEEEKRKAEREAAQAEREAARQELLSLKDEIKAVRERQERERKEQEENERREPEALENAEKPENAENDA